MSKFDNFGTRMIAIGCLTICPAAQRKLDLGRVKKIAANFVMGKMRSIAVSYRDEKYYVVDGQHAVAAAKKVLADLTYLIECRVYEGLSEADEAELFLALDDQKAVHVSDKFRVGVTQGHGAAFEVNRVLGELGLTVGPGGIIAVQSLLSIHRMYGTIFLRDILSLILQSLDPSDDRFAGMFMKGLARFVAKYRTKIVFTRLIKVLQQTTATDILRDASRLAVKNKDAAIVSVIIGLYDYRRPIESRLVHTDL